eukprot:TRINITY_DN1477_c0_g5_i1.p1 TRINITY_DN1477_c0_g5~~TRINITY_DN1477_c0_g5_i1.p1  ORF type:complete len:187 (-),score=23.26 TRINITY_DN1477_c0_g5_i1:242-802(-)
MACTRRLIILLGLAIAEASRDPYTVLGVKRGATASEIKRAYMAAALQWHPDKNKAPEAQARFIEISHAYEELSGSKRSGATPSRRRGPTFRYEPDNMSPEMAAALKMFAEAVGLEDLLEDGSVDWEKVSARLSGLAVSAGEAASNAIKKRYLHDDGTIQWKKVVGDVGMAGAAIYTLFGSSSSDDL